MFLDFIASISSLILSILPETKRTSLPAYIIILPPAIEPYSSVLLLLAKKFSLLFTDLPFTIAFNIGLFLEPLELLSMNNTLSLESVLKPVTVFLNAGEIILPLGISEYLPKTNLPIESIPI
nr:MAG TPA: hypothetical protein [Bacteriophage sp.]